MSELSEATGAGGVDLAIEDPLLDVRDLRKWFPIKRGVFRLHVGDVKAVDGISFHVGRGETLTYQLVSLSTSACEMISAGNNEVTVSISRAELRLS